MHEQRTPGGGFKPAVWLATGFWVGFIPWAPGTFGTLLGLPLAWGLAQLGLPGMAAATAVICLAGIPVCTRAARQLGEGKDPGSIVLDEIASVPITFFGIGDWSWGTVLAGFLLHRLFDITKPPPARQLERLPDGLGIMADDWMAGLYSNLALRLVLWLMVATGT
ncbi:MAG TPA: phosphatidylglycerophosphatase A [Pirellulales bacterium]